MTSVEEKKRADLGFDSAFEDVDVSEWKAEAKPKPENSIDKDVVEKVAENSGFQSREVKKKSAPPKKKVIARMQKNFRPNVENCEKFDFLASSMITSKEGPELIDEALALLFKKYKEDMKFFEDLKKRKLSS